MPRTYVRTTTRGSWDPAAMQRAVEAVTNGDMGAPKAAKTYNVPQTTLERRVKLGITTAMPLGPKKTVFTAVQEEELVDHILGMEASLHGLTLADVETLAYQFAERNNLPHPFKNGKAGDGWLDGFRKRHPALTLRTPEATSGMRARGFNKPVIDKFFELLEELQDAHHFPATRMFNVDETGITTVPNRQSKILAKRGKKQVGQKTSAERGQLITVEICMSASGIFVPPLLIFPRIRMKAELMDGTPSGSISSCHPSGWMQTDIFTEWMAHFIQFVKPTAEDPVLLILDGHSTHTKNLDALLMAKENAVHILCLPPHTTHRLQPLDVSFMLPLSAFYEQEVRKWLREHPGRQVSMFQVGALFGAAFQRACTTTTAVNGFRKCGIYPLNREVFQEEDFAAADETDVPRTASPIPPLVTETPAPVRSATPTPGTSYVSPQDILPIPKATRRPESKRGRPRGRTAVLTSSPYVAEQKATSSTKSSGIAPRKRLFHEAEQDADPVLSDDSDDIDIGQIEEERVALLHDPLELARESDVKPGSWLLVKLAGGRRGATSFRYVVRARSDVDDDDGEIQVQGFRSVDYGRTLFEEKEKDIFFVPFEDVLGKLEEPEVEISPTGRAIRFRFAGQINVKEV